MKYLKKFETFSQYENYMAGDEVFLPNVSVCEDTPDFVGYNPWHEPPQPNDEIWYTSSDGNIVEPTGYIPNMISNTYVDGKGIIKCEFVVTNIEDTAFDGCSSLTSISIPNSVTRIRDYVFQNCSSLASINIPDSVKRIGEGTFVGCSSLTSVNIPDSVTQIDWGAFYDCSSLTDFNYSGIMSQWNNVSLGEEWNINAPFTVVHCADGDSTRL